MRIRRCFALLVEPVEASTVDLAALFAGSPGFAVQTHWVGLAAHLDEPVPLTVADLQLLMEVSDSVWSAVEALGESSRVRAEALIVVGLLLAQSGGNAGARERDERVRGTHWHPHSAVVHAHSRWLAVSQREDASAQFQDIGDMVSAYGPAPATSVEVGDAAAQITLPAPPAGAFDSILGRRKTVRNFAATELALDDFASVMQRTFGATQEVELAPGVSAIRRNSPSGGSLHPIDPYLLVQRVRGLAPGLYHYNSVRHLLAPMLTTNALSMRGAGKEIRETALAWVADQDWFADAPVMIVLVARFRRNFWKYRNHPKAYRAVVLDAGHLSQMLYLAAAEIGLGAFITAAINEHRIESDLGLDGLCDGPLAVVGFGAFGTGPWPEFAQDGNLQGRLRGHRAS